MRLSSGSGNHSRKDVHLHLDVSPPELTAHADAERLHQVVANLIDNAVKHSPPHGRVTVRARRGAQPESLDLEVLDEGPGIPESERHRVFERFNRGEAPSPHGPGSDGGTGLGLAIARWAVDLHGGRIGVAESARGCRIKSLFQGSLNHAVDIGFEPEGHVLRVVPRGDTVHVAVATASRTRTEAKPGLFPAISCAETRSLM